MLDTLGAQSTAEVTFRALFRVVNKGFICSWREVWCLWKHLYHISVLIFCWQLRAEIDKHLASKKIKVLQNFAFKLHSACNIQPPPSAACCSCVFVPVGRERVCEGC